MQYLNVDMDEFFRKAAEDYPLNIRGANWEKVQPLLSTNKVPDTNTTKKQHLLFICLQATFPSVLAFALKKRMSLYQNETLDAQPVVVQFEPGAPVLIQSDDICVIYPPGRLSKSANKYMKRMVDIGLSSIIIFCLFPILLPLIALLIWLDSGGPIFFLQKRNKIHGGVFTCMKFRTMVGCTASNNQHSGTDETQITRVGKFLRHTHLDELPQLFNVWIGDMSLVGPRPYMICDNQRWEMLVPRYHLRHTIKPGITGLAQAAGLTGPMQDLPAVEERWNKDITYIHKWSLWLDVKILWATVRNIVSSMNFKNSMPTKNAQP